MIAPATTTLVDDLRAAQAAYHDRATSVRNPATDAECIRLQDEIKSLVRMTVETRGTRR